MKNFNTIYAIIVSLYLYWLVNNTTKQMKALTKWLNVQLAGIHSNKENTRMVPTILVFINSTEKKNPNCSWPHMFNLICYREEYGYYVYTKTKDYFIELQDGIFIWSHVSRCTLLIKCLNCLKCIVHSARWLNKMDICKIISIL